MTQSIVQNIIFFLVKGGLAKIVFYRDKILSASGGSLGLFVLNKCWCWGGGVEGSPPCPVWRLLPGHEAAAPSRSSKKVGHESETVGLPAGRQAGRRVPGCFLAVMFRPCSAHHPPTPPPCSVNTHTHARTHLPLL